MKASFLTQASLPDDHALLADLQCNTLAPHRRNLSIHLFFNLGPNAAANRRYLEAWADRATPLSEQVKEEALRTDDREEFITRRFAAASWSTKARRWFESIVAPARAAERYEAELTPILEDFWQEEQSARSLVKSVMLSSTGLMKLEPWCRRQGQPGLPVTDRPWQRGMFDHETALSSGGRGHQQNWLPPFFDKDNPQVRQTVDVHVILAMDGPAEDGQAQPRAPKALLDAIAEEKKFITDAGGTWRGETWGYLCRHPQKGFQEHFGFRDGISNVHVLDGEIARARDKFSSRPAGTTLENLLYEFKLPTGATAYGTLCVLRQIEEHLAQAAAMDASVVGRKADGTPLAKATGLDGFGFQGDMTAPPPPPACPFHAHIRKANPRGTSGEADETSVLLARRGMLYGKRAYDHETRELGAASGPVGLLFLAYMGKIEQQFVRMQKTWLASDTFPRHATQADALVGDPSLRHPAGLTTMRGGEYFFVPPRSWLRDPGEPGV